MLPSGNDAWPTDEDLRAAHERFAALIPGYVQPTAYTLARRDPGGLTVGYLNGPGGEHKLPAAVLASVCGYVDRTGVFRLSLDQVAEAVELLAPAEAATHWAHPNLWSWRRLLTAVEPGSSYLAYFVAPGREDESEAAGWAATAQASTGGMASEAHTLRGDVGHRVPKQAAVAAQLANACREMRV